jgi:uncharacterized membrane protein
MSSTRHQRPRGRPSTDLLVLLAGVLLGTAAYFLLPPGWEVLRGAVALVLVFLLPGYGLVSLAYPRVRRPDDEPEPLRSSSFERWIVQSPPLMGGERIALSFGISLVVLPLATGLVLAITGEISRTPLVVTFVSLTLLAGAAAFVRRRRLPRAERYGVTLTTLWAPIAGRGGLDTLLNVLLAIAIVVSSAGFGYALLAPNEGESYTSFALLTENDEGDLVAGNYPTEFRNGESRSMTARVANHETGPQSYTVVVVVERVRTEDGEATVLQRSVHRQFEFDLDPGETWQTQHEIAPTMQGEDVRVRYLLYRGSPPDNLDPGDAYRDLYVWIDVEG